MSMNRKSVIIYTDGACSGNPGAGGWAAILRYGAHEKELCGGQADTTNNRMELSAVIEALHSLKEPCEVTLYTDSQYIARAINEGWLENWQQKGWKKADKAPVKNEDLWKDLASLLKKHSVSFVWVKGHDGQIENERCDTLAVGMVEKYKQKVQE